MKILCVIDYLCAGGAQRQMVNMAVEFKRKGNDVSFLVYYEHDFYKGILNENNINVFTIETQNHFMRILKMRKYIRNGNFDTVISFLETPSFITALSTLPTKNFKFIIGERNANPNILKSLRLKFYRYFHFTADHIVANSSENIKIVKKVNPFLSDNKLSVIYNMIDHELWKPDEKELNLNNEDTIRLVVLARYHSSKNCLGMITAYNYLPDKEKKRLQIDWYGEQIDNTYTDAVDKVNQLNLNENIRLNKATNSAIEILKKADVIGLFSFYEGLPNVVIEGMSLSKVILTSNFPDASKLINDKELIFDPNDTQDIVKSFMYLLSLNKDELKLIGKKNRTVSLEKFAKENIIDEYLKLMN